MQVLRAYYSRSRNPVRRKDNRRAVGCGRDDRIDVNPEVLHHGAPNSFGANQISGKISLQHFSELMELNLNQGRCYRLTRTGKKSALMEYEI